MGYNLRTRKPAQDESEGTKEPVESSRKRARVDEASKQFPRKSSDQVKKNDSMEQLRDLLPFSLASKLSSQKINKVSDMSGANLEQLSNTLKAECGCKSGSDADILTAWLRLLNYIAETPVKNQKKNKLTPEAWMKGEISTAATSSPAKRTPEKKREKFNIKPDELKKGKTHLNPLPTGKSLMEHHVIDSPSILKERKSSLHHLTPREAQRKDLTKSTPKKSPQLHGKSSKLDAQILSTVPDEVILHKQDIDKDHLLLTKKELITVPSGKNLMLHKVIESPRVLKEAKSHLHHESPRGYKSESLATPKDLSMGGKSSIATPPSVSPQKDGGSRIPNNEKERGGYFSFPERQESSKRDRETDKSTMTSSGLMKPSTIFHTGSSSGEMRSSKSSLNSPSREQSYSRSMSGSQGMGGGAGPISSPSSREAMTGATFDYSKFGKGSNQDLKSSSGGLSSPSKMSSSGLGISSYSSKSASNKFPSSTSSGQQQSKGHMESWKM